MTAAAVSFLRALSFNLPEGTEENRGQC